MSGWASWRRGCLARPHQPVLAGEVVRLLSGKAVVVDATVGAGGHAEVLLESGVGSVFGLDRDPSAVAEASERLARFGPRFRAARARFRRFAQATYAPRVRAGGAGPSGSGTSS